MNIFQKVTLKNLKENRTRTLVTIIGIILSAAMFSATTISISSLQHYLIQSTIYEKGNWYGAGYGLSAENLETISSDKQVKKAISMELIGFSALKDYNNDYKPYLCVYGIQQDFTTMMPIHLTQGRMPENKNELLLPDHLFTNGGINYQLDSTLELNLGNRVDKEGTLLNNQVEYQNEVEDKNNYIDHLENSKDTMVIVPTGYNTYKHPADNDDIFKGKLYTVFPTNPIIENKKNKAGSIFTAYFSVSARSDEVDRASTHHARTENKDFSIHDKI